jgi:hypothetical protein
MDPLQLPPLLSSRFGYKLFSAIECVGSFLLLGLYVDRSCLMPGRKLFEALLPLDD